MAEMENNLLIDLLGLEPDHDLHFYVPICE